MIQADGRRKLVAGSFCDPLDLGANRPAAIKSGA